MKIPILPCQMSPPPPAPPESSQQSLDRLGKTLDELVEAFLEVWRGGNRLPPLLGDWHVDYCRLNHTHIFHKYNTEEILHLTFTTKY